MLPSHSQFMRIRFFEALDGLRALSIGVIWSHVWYVSGPAYYNTLIKVPVLRNGAFGVSIFFGISGFLITTVLLHGTPERCGFKQPMCDYPDAGDKSE